MKGIFKLLKVNKVNININYNFNFLNSSRMMMNNPTTNTKFLNFNTRYFCSDTPPKSEKNENNENKEIKKHPTQIQRNSYFSVIKNSSSIIPSKEYKIEQVIGNKKTIKIKFYKNKQKQINKKPLKDKIKKKLWEIFLPKGYPHSVNDGYYKFVVYSFLNNVIFYFLNFIAAQVAIESLGASMKTSVIASAGLNWALKEGLGQVSSIFLLSKLGKTAERNVKEWRAISTNLLYISFFIELSILLVPKYFIYLAATASLFKITFSLLSLVTRTGLFQCITKDDRILVDLVLKFQNQSNVAIFLGNTLGFLATFFIDLDFPLSLSIFSVGTALGIYFTIRSNKDIVISDFNYQRLYYFTKLFLSEGKIVTPKEVAKYERMFFSTPTIKFCTKSPDYILQQSKEYVIGLLNLYQQSNFICFAKSEFSFKKMRFQYVTYVFLRINYTEEDIFKAMLCACKLNEILNDALYYKDSEILKLTKNCLDFTNNSITEEMKTKMKEVSWKLSFSNVIDEKTACYHTVNVEDTEIE